MANLFAVSCTKCYQNRERFPDDMTKKIGLLFLGHGVLHPQTADVTGSIATEAVSVHILTQDSLTCCHGM